MHEQIDALEPIPRTVQLRRGRPLAASEPTTGLIKQPELENDMKTRRIWMAAATASLSLSSLALGAAPAGAAHCADNGGPGNSDFADHVRANNGPGGHNEGDHQGWSSCEEQARSGGR